MIERRPTLGILAHVVLVIGVLIVAFPIYLTFVASTHTAQEIVQAPMPLLPGPHLVENYTAALTGTGESAGSSAPVGRMMTVSLVSALVITIGKIAISLLSAFAVVYFRFPLRGLCFWAIFVTLMLPVEVRIGPTYAVISDLGASGAYYIASAADQIYADKASLVGSIGVTAASFGFVDTMEKLGVERRVYTSGEHKAFLDPFQPQKDEETRFWKTVLDTTHKQFIDSVKKGRGDRLKDAEHPELFSGLIWSGEQALSLGLIDGLGSTSYVAREVIGQEEMVDFTVQESPLDRFTKKLGASVAEHIALWMGFQGPTLR